MLDISGASIKGNLKKNKKVFIKVKDERIVFDSFATKTTAVAEKNPSYQQKQHEKYLTTTIPIASQQH